MKPQKHKLAVRIFCAAIAVLMLLGTVSGIVYSIAAA